MLRALTQDTEIIHQNVLETAIRSIFPGATVVSNARKQSQIINPLTGHYFEIDVWLPDLGLCFEFQDTYHYVATWYSQKSLFTVQQKDPEQLRSNDQTLLIVPCWWDGSVESLASTISFYRPDLIANESSKRRPISFNPVEGYFANPIIPDVGELMLASFPHDISHISMDKPWWLGEKYDGIRLCWNSERKQLYTRNGVELYLPDPFSKLLASPSIPFLDSEAWFGRGHFLACQRLVSSDFNLIDWSLLRFVTFDVPSVQEHTLPFEKRFSLLLESIPITHPFLRVVGRMKVEKKTKIIREMARRVIEEGGEGLMLRRSQSLYVPGRSPSLLLKFKATRGDTEALVVTVGDSDLTLKLPSEVQFTVERDPNIEVKEGDIVTINYDHFTQHSIPVNPKLYRIRKDLSWFEVQSNFMSSDQQGQFNEASRLALGISQKPFGYWTSEKRNNIRKFLEKLARHHGYDPLVADDWYSLSASSEIKQAIGRKLAFYKDSLATALVDLFPEIGIDKSKFVFLQKNYWGTMSHRRKFFIELAQKLGLDPLDPHSWYSLPYSKVIQFKGGESVLKYYGKSLTKALMNIFPEIGLEENNFPFVARYHWDSIENRRNLFVNVATQSGLDPLLPSTWYTIPASSVLKHRGGSSVLALYNGNFYSALNHLFPDIGLSKTNFKKAKTVKYDV